MQWAIEHLARRRGTPVVEFGCGSGVAIAMLLERADRPIVHGVDRSSAAVDRAMRLNAGAIEQGRVHLMHADFTQVQPATPYRQAFAINVNDFWTRSAKAFAAAAEWMIRGGELLLVYEAPSERKTGDILRALSHGAATPGFSVVRCGRHPEQASLVALHLRRTRGAFDER